MPDCCSPSCAAAASCRPHSLGRKCEGQDCADHDHCMREPHPGLLLDLVGGYSMTSSARASRDSGIARSSALDVLKLKQSSILVGCSTGRSLGLAPANAFASITAAWR